MKYQKYLQKNLPDLSGKTILITGANSGLGLASSKLLAFQGAEIIMACRSKEKALKAKEEILKEVPNAKLTTLEYDQTDFEIIDQFVITLKNTVPAIDALICNAGIFHPRKKKLINQTPITSMTNFFGLYYFLNKMTTYLNESGKQKGQLTRVVLVTSLAGYYRKKLNLKALTNSKLSFFKQYKNSKKAVNVLFHGLNTGLNLFDFSSRENISYHLAHPGVSHTNIIQGYKLSFQRLATFIMKIFLPNPYKASLPIVYSAGSKYLKNGSFMGPGGLFEIAGYPRYLAYPEYVVKGSGQFLYEVGKYIMEIRK